jgi:hypothetical protein
MDIGLEPAQSCGAYAHASSKDMCESNNGQAISFASPIFFWFERSVSCIDRIRYFSNHSRVLPSFL